MRQGAVESDEQLMMLIYLPGMFRDSSRGEGQERHVLTCQVHASAPITGRAGKWDPQYAIIRRIKNKDYDYCYCYN